MTTPNTPFQILGESGIQRLCEDFYRIMDTRAEVRELRAMHAADLGPVTEKLAEYLTGWMGGPPRYAEKYGSVCLTEAHAPFHIGPEERDQWLWCMEQALAAGDADEELREMLRIPLQRIADAVRNRDQPSATKTNPNVIAAG
ncbi:globin [Kineobactrum sediminis]|uniref:Globin n=1 Tax=Kineobactrum sediminis TaxID=1905677 RepID=A0A2N5Y446_9GAMM|nr:group II truncated hemoglobin [Kineobactrum sediminis]PLW83173.1 globin [Kineobactrum sediminis]